MNNPPTQSRRVPVPPRGIAISGIIFAILFILSVTLMRVAVPADPAEPGEWLGNPVARKGVGLALNLIPFTGLAFLWFMGALRNQVGMLEDQFFATVFLGSGLLFVAMLFAAGSVARGLFDTFGPEGSLAGASEAYTIARGTSYSLMNTFGMKMAAVFMFMSSTIGLRTGAISRWVSFVGFAFGLIMLLVIGDFAWIVLLFPIWALVVSTNILHSNFRQGSAAPGDSEVVS